MRAGRGALPALRSEALQAEPAAACRAAPINEAAAVFRQLPTTSNACLRIDLIAIYARTAISRAWCHHPPIRQGNATRTGNSLQPKNERTAGNVMSVRGHPYNLQIRRSCGRGTHLLRTPAQRARALRAVVGNTHVCRRITSGRTAHPQHRYESSGVHLQRQWPVRSLSSNFFRPARTIEG